MSSFVRRKNAYDELMAKSKTKSIKNTSDVTEDDTPIAKLRNLGPACERDLNAVGIYTLADIKAIGVEQTFLQMMNGRNKTGNGGGCFNASYLYALYGAVHDLDWRDLPEVKKAEFKKLTEELRENG